MSNPHHPLVTSPTQGTGRASRVRHKGRANSARFLAPPLVRIARPPRPSSSPVSIPVDPSRRIPSQFHRLPYLEQCRGKPSNPIPLDVLCIASQGCEEDWYITFCSTSNTPSKMVDAQPSEAGIVTGVSGSPKPNLLSRRISYDSVGANLKPLRDLSLGSFSSAAPSQTSAATLRGLPAQASEATLSQTVEDIDDPPQAHEKPSGGMWKDADKPKSASQVQSTSIVVSSANNMIHRQDLGSSTRSTPYVNGTDTLPGAQHQSSYDAASAFPSAVSPRRERTQAMSNGHGAGVVNDLDALSAGFRNLRVVAGQPQPTWAPPPHHHHHQVPRAAYTPEQAAYLSFYGQGQPDLVAAAAAAAATAHGAGPYYEALNWQPTLAQASPTLYQQQNQAHIRRAQQAWQLTGLPTAGIPLDRAPSRSPVQSYSPTFARNNFYGGQEAALSPLIDYNRASLTAAGLVSPYGFAGQLSVLPSQQVQSQRIYRSPLLEEFRANRHRRWEMEDIRGYICEFASDQLGSRHIQTKLETASLDEKAIVFAEALPNLLSLCTDTFGNYVCQKLFEIGDRDQKAALVDAFRGSVLRLSLQSYACRVVQKAIEQVNLEQQIQLVSELDGHVLKCARDQNANHTLQKIISCMPSEKIGFISDACLGQVFALATHPYGCRVLQRILENMRNVQPLIDELIKYAQNLIQDQYGNYLAQHLLEHGPVAARSAVIARVRGQIFNLSRHKFASNVIDKAILCSTEEERHLLTDEILTDPSAVGLMLRDPFANYPLQKFLLTVQGPQREVLLSRTAEALANLKRYSATYSKHLMAIEKWVLNAPATGLNGNHSQP